MLSSRSIYTFFCIFALCSSFTFAQSWETIPAADARIHYVGRTWDASNNAGETGKMFAWSGTSAVLSFEGTSVKALISRPSNAYGVDSSWYRVFIDGDSAQDIAYKDYNEKDEILLAENLQEGTHTVTFYKRTEVQVGSQLFLGFSVLGASTSALQVPERRLEFIGNSISCGYGVRDSCTVNPSTWAVEGTCPSFTSTSEDHYYSYGAVAARALGAEDQTLCWSGKGLLRNINGGDGTPTMPLEWEYAQPVTRFSDTTTAAKWDYSKYIPHAVIINLGTNDFSYSTNPAEADFVGAYVAFIQRIQAEYGDSIPILLLEGPMLSDSYPADQKVASTLEKYIDSTIAKTGPMVHKLILTVNQSTTLGIGADWHPDKAQNRLNGAELETKLRAILNWEGTGSIDSPLTLHRQFSQVVKFFNNQIELELAQSGMVSLKLFSLDGKIVHKIQEYRKTGKNLFVLPGARLTNGLYILNVSIAGKVWNQSVFIHAD